MRSKSAPDPLSKVVRIQSLAWCQELCENLPPDIAVMCKHLVPIAMHHHDSQELLKFLDRLYSCRLSQLYLLTGVGLRAPSTRYCCSASPAQTPGTARNPSRGPSSRESPSGRRSACSIRSCHVSGPQRSAGGSPRAQSRGARPHRWCSCRRHRSHCQKLFHQSSCRKKWRGFLEWKPYSITVE
jgi:hypothetical protein